MDRRVVVDSEGEVVGWIDTAQSLTWTNTGFPVTGEPDRYDMRSLHLTPAGRWVTAVAPVWDLVRARFELVEDDDLVVEWFVRNGRKPSGFNGPADPTKPRAIPNPIQSQRLAELDRVLASAQL
ncbi:MAG: hypothetical protein OEY23_09055 [Acidimicrobiia bacterium]|nr:hypothetical protein [Acidimicrobiia bacterium]